MDHALIFSHGWNTEQTRTGNSSADCTDFAEKYLCSFICVNPRNLRMLLSVFDPWLKFSGWLEEKKRGRTLLRPPNEN
jgi:hypothetical protein